MPRSLSLSSFSCSSFFFFNDTATTEIYTLSLHDALPISPRPALQRREQLCRESSPRKRAGTTMGAGILGDERRTEAARRRNSLCQATGGAPSGRGRGAGSFARSSEMTKRRECSQPEGWDTRAPELSPLPESQFS